MIVADTNIIAYLLLPSPFSDEADKLYTLDPEWAAPTLWKSELRNVLALYLRKGILALEQALHLQESAESMLAGHEFDVPSSQVLSLAKQSGCSAYDCEVVALALHLNVPLITQDQKVLKAFPEAAMTVADFLSR